jgi:hypothetical protein
MPNTKTQSNNSSTGYQVELIAKYDIEKLKKEWKIIEQTYDTPFFLSWTWVSNWLQSYQPEFLTLTVRYQTKIVAIGLFTLSNQIRHKILYSRQLRLNQTGNKQQDQVWIEYNDFIAIPEHLQKASNIGLNFLNDQHQLYDEIILSMVKANRVTDFHRSGIDFTIIDRKPGYFVNLDEIRSSSSSFLESLSRNSRYQIRRSMRLYEKLYGKIEIQKAKTTQQALEFFQGAGTFHVVKWKDSGFLNQEFIKFHTNLISTSFDQGKIDLIKIISGDNTLGYLYNFIGKKNIYFYLSGLKYEMNRKLKPGLVAHSLIIQHYLDSGFQIYDFMGGESQYKKTLSTGQSEFLSLNFQKPAIKFKIETGLRRIKSLLSSSFKNTTYE